MNAQEHDAEIASILAESERIRALAEKDYIRLETEQIQLDYKDFDRGLDFEEYVSWWVKANAIKWAVLFEHK
jgi:hypothetical protein